MSGGPSFLWMLCYNRKPKIFVNFSVDGSSEFFQTNFHINPPKSKKALFVVSKCALVSSVLLTGLEKLQDGKVRNSDKNLNCFFSVQKPRFKGGVYFSLFRLGSEFSSKFLFHFLLIKIRWNSFDFSLFVSFCHIDKLASILYLPTFSFR